MQPNDSTERWSCWPWIRAGWSSVWRARRQLAAGGLSPAARRLLEAHEADLTARVRRFQAELRARRRGSP